MDYSDVHQSKLQTPLQGPVVRSPISANPGLNFNPGSAFPRVVFSVLFRVSYNQIVDEKN